MRVLLTALVLLAAACGHTLPTVKGKAPTLPHEKAGLSVGTARADITMAPGTSTFGHGPDARSVDGYWGRTYCRVFYFETDRGQKLALIPCELPAMSLMLQRRVASKVQDLHASQIMMTAIHTHAGVAHYFGARQYTGLFSTRNPGYDEAMVEALAKRIAGALEQDIKEKRRAKLSWAHHDDMWCFTRNRSVQAYRLNKAENGVFAPPVPDPWPAEQPCAAPTREDYRAIDPSLDILRIDTLTEKPEDSEPIGSVSFYAMHPTIVSNTNQYVGGDVAGMVNRLVEARLRREWMDRHPDCTAYWAKHECSDAPAPAHCAAPDPLHGIVNTNEGDISPRWTRGDIEEAISFGTRLSAWIWSRHPSADAGQAQVIIDSRYIEDNIRGAQYHNADKSKHTTCGYPQVGQGAARGASDHPTSVASIPMFSSDPVVDYESGSCHEPKRPLLGPLSASTKGEGAFPSDLPLGVSRIGDTLIAFLPAELTITTGHRLRMRVAKSLSGFSGRPSRIVIAGLANEYIQYIATPEEYQLQNYEGASTLYGPDSSGYFENRITLLARSMFDPAYQKHLEKKLGRAGEIAAGFGPSAERFARPDDPVKPKAGGLCTMPGPDDSPRLCMYWRDGGPGAVPLREQPWIRLMKAAGGCDKPALSCWGEGYAQCDGGGSIDDTGHHFRTQIHEEVDGLFVWSTLLDPGAELWSQLGSSTLHIEVGGKLKSAGFSRTKLPDECSVRQTRLCLEGHRTEHWDGLVQ